MRRQTIITLGRFAMRELRLQAAREASSGLSILTIEQFVARLAGGFVRAIDKDTLRATIMRVKENTHLGELEPIKSLPGFSRAAADTFCKAWLAGIDIAARQGEHPRIAAIASLEQAVLRELPANTLTPTELAKRALARVQHVRAIFGEVEVRGFTELSPCWRELIGSVAGETKVTWHAGTRAVPEWLDGNRLEITTSCPEHPGVTCVSAATAYHEAIEAMRWARALIASKQAKPEEIAIAATACDDYDDHLLALRSDANIDVHFAHGIPVTATRDGQACAALAELVLRGLSRTRMHRLARLLGKSPGPFECLPEDWLGAFPESAPLTRLESWRNLILAQGDLDYGAQVQDIVAMIDRGAEFAEDTGTALLTGKARLIWRQALLLGPPESLDLSIERLRTDDSFDPGNSIAWAPASSLAAAPRPHVYLLGLNSQRWPHVAFEDRLLSDHIIPTSQLDPLPVNLADTRDFETILATSAASVVLSHARRDHEGRLLGRSALLQGQPKEMYLGRHRVPVHACSEVDRLAARVNEFADMAPARMAAGCWRDWNDRQDLTAHDGIVRADHPIIKAILQRTQSAASLRLLLRNPIGFLWRYGLGLIEPQASEDPLILDAIAMGELVHEMLEHSLVALEDSQGLANVSEGDVRQAVDQASSELAEHWQLYRAVPPRKLWQRSLMEARKQSERGLLLRQAGAVAHAEVPFGGADIKTTRELPWDAQAPVEIPQAGFLIQGYIDRLDLGADGASAWVRDYKTGKTPKIGDARPFVLDKGRELQRCLYAYAVRAMLGPQVDIHASLHYLRDDVDLALADAELVLETLSFFLASARTSFQSGVCVIGADAGDTYDDLAFALPANAANIYCKVKRDLVRDKMNEAGNAADVWEAD